MSVRTTDRREARELIAGRCADPHALLGAHSFHVDEGDGIVVRAHHPDAVGIDCVLEDGTAVPLERFEETPLFTGFFPGSRFPFRYRLRFRFPGDAIHEREDPYRFPPSLGDMDAHLFNEGTHRRLWEVMGAHPRRIDGVDGVSFAVWAPSARRVSVIGDFCHWDGRVFPMRVIGSSGIFEIFIPGLESGTLYKYEILTQERQLRVKTDPFAASMEYSPGHASRVVSRTGYEWGDGEWMERRRSVDPVREPMLVYEVHAGSWRFVPEENHRSLTYREMAPLLVEHARRFGFTHVEFLPIMEHPYGGSWGYQVSGYYAPTSRFGSPDDFRYLVDTLHRAGIGVLLDWVPAHFPKDDFALRRFDGTALFEHLDPRLGEHPDWGTLIFNYGRNEVRNFLLANALYWLEEFHIDGLRVDAVASMIYLDYSRKEGEWIPNRYGGKENLDAIQFLRTLNRTIREEVPGAIMIAEESTAWPGVSESVANGGLGFTFKWNMGWMHDTLFYFSKDPVHRTHHQGVITFAMLYEYTERFIMPLSHDEVVHGKRSLLSKMPGDPWQQFANLRLLLAYQYTRPGKSLLFMGTEVAPYHEWHHEWGIDWSLERDPARQRFARFLEDLGRFYRDHPPLWRKDSDPAGFSWIDCTDHANSVLAYIRSDDGGFLVIVLNMTPVPREDYRIGIPAAASYALRLSSDDPAYGGSDYETPSRYAVEKIPSHGFEQSIRLRLPPLGALILQPEK
jgi:1,4-alpha-glucan branching enzyme